MNDTAFPVHGFALLIIASLLMACGPDGEDSDTNMDVVPVTVQGLRETDYGRERRLTGSVGLYREEQIGFEVAGRMSVLDEGFEVEGPAYDERGRLVQSGEVIATLDNTRYGLQVGALEARSMAAQRGVDAIEAQLRLAEQTLEREQNILNEGAGTQQAVDNAQSAFDSTGAQLAAARANVEAIEADLNRAREDRADTTLLAPFSGRITAVHISQGAVVDAGTPVVTLTLMDPVQVQVQVSADSEREIRTGARARVFPRDPLQGGKPVPVSAIVYEKSAVADPRTRTFRIDLIVRNERRRVEQLDPAFEGLPAVNDYLPVARRYQGEEGPLFVPSEGVLREGGKTYVLRLTGVSLGTGSERSATGRHQPEKIEVELTDDYMTVIRWNFRGVREGSGLEEGEVLIVRPQPSYVEGVAVGRPQWLFRPGDLVPVEFVLAALPTGFYVPIRAIVSVAGRPAVLLVEGDRARLVDVSVHETYEELQRITGEGVVDGARVIVGGAHYVSDGQPVAVVNR